jgi:hypothetical protein
VIARPTAVGLLAIVVASAAIGCDDSARVCEATSALTVAF